MKKLLSFLFAIMVIAVLFLQYPSVNASGIVSFSLAGTDVKTGKTAKLNMNASSDTPVCAAVFEFSYDDSLLSFEKVSCKSPSKAFTHASKGFVRVVFADEGGASSEMFTICFKALSAGDAVVSFTAFDCADNNAEWMSIGECTSSPVHIYQSKANTYSTKPTKPDKTDNTKRPLITRPPKVRSVVETAPTFEEDRESEPIELNELPRKTNFKPIIAWIVIGVCSLLLIGLAFVAGIKLALKRSKTEPDSNSEF